jgi:signal transduction histidine kinase
MLITWLQRHPRFVDWALFLLALVTLGGAAYHRHQRVAGIFLAALTCVPLLFRRAYPLPVLAITTLATVLIVGHWGDYNFLPAGIALYTVASMYDRRTSLAAGSASVAAIALAVWSSFDWGLTIGFPGRLLPFAVAWVVGDSVRTRREYIAALEERAERLEREQAAEAARAVAEEQARIARELHDVITHNVSVMVVQAAAANDVFVSRPDRAREALRNIEQTGRSALDELRRLLLGVRDGGAEYAPLPGIRDLDELLAQVRTAGLDVAMTIEGPPTPLPPAIDLSAYRVVQEALTNTLKHAHASRADVRVRYGDGEFDLRIHDDGIGAAAEQENGARHGLIGMRERLALLGGSLAAGPDSSGGFTVSATFPLGTPS